MKRPVFYMALPVTLVAAVMLFNQSSSKNCQNKSYYQQIQAGFNAGVDTLRPDPICNMKVDDKKGDTIHYKGHIFGFCSKYCRTEFMKNPDSYLPKKKD